MNNKPLSNSSFRKSILDALHHYFETLEGGSIGNVYELIMAEVEQPLLEVVMHHAQGNQSRAAKWLGLNRGTLRKLLTKYHVE